MELKYRPVNGNVLLDVPFSEKEKQIRDSKLILDDKTKAEVVNSIEKEHKNLFKVLAVASTVTEIKVGDMVSLKHPTAGFSPNHIFDGENRFLVIHANFIDYVV